VRRWLASAATLICACADPVTSEVLIAFDVDPLLEPPIAELAYRLRGGPRGETRVIEEAVECATWPRHFALVPAGGDLARVFELHLTALGLDRTPVARAILRGEFPENRVELFRFELSNKCTKDICAVDAFDLPEAPPADELRTFDAYAPRLQIFFPPEGAMVLGDTVNIAGHADDRSRIASADIAMREGSNECARFRGLATLSRASTRCSPSSSRAVPRRSCRAKTLTRSTR
jgi:hypothetical protein